MLELALEVVVDLVGQLYGDQTLAVVVPLRVDADQQVRFLPVDWVAEDVTLAGAGCVEPEAEEPVLPDRAGCVVGAGDESRMRCADRLAVQRFAHPHAPLAAIEEAHVGVLAVVLIAAQSGRDPRAGFVRTAAARPIALAEAEHDP